MQQGSGRNGGCGGGCGGSIQSFAIVSSSTSIFSPVLVIIEVYETGNNILLYMIYV